VGSIPPLTSQLIAPNNWDRAQLGRDLNTAIRANVQQRQAAGQRVRFADIYSVLTLADLYDGVHPTEEAHAKVAGVWLDALRTVPGAYVDGGTGAADAGTPDAGTSDAGTPQDGGTPDAGTGTYLPPGDAGTAQVQLTVHTGQAVHSISPYIYGTNAPDW